MVLVILVGLGMVFWGLLSVLILCLSVGGGYFYIFGIYGLFVSVLVFKECFSFFNGLLLFREMLSMIKIIILIW